MWARSLVRLLLAGALPAGAVDACGGDAPRRPAPPRQAPLPATRSAAPLETGERLARPASRPAARAPSALHVIRAPGVAPAAGAPLPEPLGVEVFDSRGRPAAGATVVWRVRSGGGRVTPERGTTNDSGVAIADWRLGATADTQTIDVRVPGVGGVELRTRVAVATTLVRPATVTLWPGDRAALRADLADAAGHALDGGAPQWESSDTSAVRVSSPGVVAAQAAGAARVTASIPGASALGAAAVTVLPVVAGRLLTPAGAPLPSRLRIAARAGGRTDSADAAAGRFTIRLRAPLGDTAEVTLAPAGDPDEGHSPPGGSPRGYSPVLLRVASPRELGALDLVLLPSRWSLTEGTFVGRTLPVSAAAAVARAGDGTHFWRLAPLGARAVPVGWPPGRLPIPVVIERGRGAASIGPADSARFWSIARELERDIGAPLFAPAPTSPEEDEGGTIRVRVEPTLREAGFTVVGWDASGDIGGATVMVRSAALLGDPRVAAHELLHALGVGHTRAWPSLMGDAGTAPSALTAEDAAYVQLLLAIRRAAAEGARSGDAPFGIAPPAGAPPVSRAPGRPVGIP